MKTTPRQLFAVLLALAASVPVARWLRADDPLPKAQPIARYDAMAERSPFTAPTAATPVPVAAPITNGPHWWDQMFVTSLMDRGGVYYAVVVDRASTKHYMLEINKTDPDSQLRMSGVQWNDHLDQTTVTVSKGAETAPPLKFDPSASSPVSPVSQAMNGPSSMQPPFTPPPRNAPINPANLPPGFTGTPPPAPPGVPNVIRRVGPIGSNPSTAQPNGMRQPPGGPPRRIIVPTNSDSGND